MALHHVREVFMGLATWPNRQAAGEDGGRQQQQVPFWKNKRKEISWALASPMAQRKMLLGSWHPSCFLSSRRKTSMARRRPESTAIGGRDVPVPRTPPNSRRNLPVTTRRQVGPQRPQRQHTGPHKSAAAERSLPPSTS